MNIKIVVLENRLVKDMGSTIQTALDEIECCGGKVRHIKFEDCSGGFSSVRIFYIFWMAL